MKQGERKHSRKRDAILRVIQSTKSHPGAQWVYDQLKPQIPDLSLGTVYRNITFFREAGIVVSLGVVNGEDRFDGDVRPHPHLVCSRCGRVVDLPCPDSGLVTALAETIPAILKTEESGEAGEFRIDYRKTVFYGLCGYCTKEPPAFTEAVPLRGACVKTTA
ncbi:MAG: transcriptional repressor [Spirochaetaceae bacterium]|jgi:Fur family peroxide stress response transcriptional regulator|nr:transcriptional repressor [Spirochaetaceae bacterium]